VGKVLLRLFISLSKDDALSRDLILCNKFEEFQILGQLGRVWQQQTEKKVLKIMKLVKLIYGEKNKQVF
jgi:hypothetical protein